LVHAALIATIAVLNTLGPERWWGTGVNMFLPQSIWAIPSVVLLPLTAFRATRWVWLPLLTLLCVLGPMMGFRWNATVTPPAGIRMRVMTYNIQLWQRANLPSIISEIRAADPDVLCLQDARAGRTTELDEFLKAWHTTSFGQYVIASKLPIADAIVGDISYDEQTHTYLRARIRVGDVRVLVASAHFATPRDALTPFRSPEFWAVGVPLIQKNLTQRLKQATALAEDVRDVKEPVIVAGDLNAPPQSLASRMLTDLGLIDVFAVAGRGYGYTFGHTLLWRKSFLRLDRILVSRHFTPITSRVGSAAGSDHRPVIADLVLAQ
jgi:endonuclease/exonuclease/phosphatase (EEP) superfamily protein YafD